MNQSFSFRFQILRDLIPHSDQKRDTASFLLEVHNKRLKLEHIAQFSRQDFPFKFVDYILMLLCR
jgi:hypothetical protein